MQGMEGGWAFSRAPRLRRSAYCSVRLYRRNGEAKLYITDSLPGPFALPDQLRLSRRCLPSMTSHTLTEPRKNLGLAAPGI